MVITEAILAITNSLLRELREAGSSNPKQGYTDD